MNPILNTLLAQLSVVFVPVLLIIFFARFFDFTKNKIVKFLGLGIYLGLICILLKESFEHSFINTIFFFILGIIISFIIGLFFTHHHHSKNENHTHNKKDVVRILGSDFLHNIVDGIVIFTAFTVGNTSGLIATVGVLLHQTLQQVGQQVLLTSFGVRSTKSIIISFIISFSIFIGLFVSFSTYTQGIIMSISSGIIAMTVYEDIKTNPINKKGILLALVGFSIMWLIIYVMPHAH